MEIEIQIGTEDQKLLIKDEILRFYNSTVMEEGSFFKIIVAKDFDLTVSQLIGAQFNGRRTDLNQAVMAKIINTNSGKILVLSPMLYTDAFDNISRSVFYLHELIHFKNNRSEQIQSGIIDFLLNDTNWLYDEYLAYHISWEKIFSAFDYRVESLESIYEITIEGFSDDLNNIEKYRSIINQIKNQKIEFENGFKEIEKTINDYLLKVTCVCALTTCKNVSFEEFIEKYNIIPLVETLLKQFIERSIVYPQWFETYDNLRNIYGYFGVQLVNMGSNNEHVVFN